ncbi:oligopeptide ABC transporter permease [Alkalihalobacillus sp. 1P02AB]|uniref:oligopeptide ABC transporter permease n=1 Tax=Alkalihalobacillus sp. 1P02AB TaxID=3132260 RepID=UPI0039A72387
MGSPQLQTNHTVSYPLKAEKLSSEKEESYFQMVLRRFMKHKLAVTGAVGLILLTIVALFAPWLAPYNPNAVTGAFAESPSLQYLLGTDQIGRDVLSRLIYAARVSLLVGVGSILISVIIGTILGLISGYVGGWVDTFIMRCTDVFMSFPHLMLILVIVSMVGPSLSNLILILGLLGWTSVARLVRGSVLSLKQYDYVKASVALGFNMPRILFKHILPNAMAPILVHATFGIAAAIIMEASLSFLGLGVQPPNASWGNMLTEAQSLTVLTSQPWLWIPAGVMIVLTVLAVNFVGDGLRDAFDPKSLK